jgi:hypothetical protein
MMSMYTYFTYQLENAKLYFNLVYKEIPNAFFAILVLVSIYCQYKIYFILYGFM